MRIDEIVIERMPLAELHPDPTNARLHDQRNLDVIKASLKEHGQYAPLLVQKSSGRVLKGNGTYLAMRQLGWTTCEVFRIDVDDLQATRIALVDNRSAELATWDDATLVALLKQAGDLDSLGWDEDEFDELLAAVTPLAGNDAEDPGAAEEADRLKELQAKWQVQPGQLWEIPSAAIAGRSHRLLCGDCTNAADVRRLMAGQRAMLFATDPPYLVNYDGTNHPHKWNEPDKNKDWSETYSDWDDEEKGEAFYHGFISVAIREAINEYAAWYCWHASARQAMLERIWKEHGAFMHQQIVWVKDRPVLTRSHYMWQHEPCMFGWIKGNKPKRCSDEHASTIWSVATVAPGTETLHPTSKPTLLFEIPMLQHSDPGDVCYEPFAGSGSQHVAGEKLGRLVYGLEIQPQYVAGILERLAGMGLEPKLLEPLGEMVEG